MQKLQTTRKIIAAWCLYDWAIAAFPVIVTTFIFATYFTSKIAKNVITGTAQWGNAMAVASIIIALLSPVLGAMADLGGKRKRWLAGFTILLIISAASLWFALPNASATYFVLAMVVLGTIGLNISLVFYNAMLPHLVPSNRIGKISGWGWGMGYFGGLTILLIAYYGFVHQPPSWLNQSTYESVRICGPLVAAWVILFTWPLFVWVPEYSSATITARQGLTQSLRDIRYALSLVWKDKNLLLFFSAQMVYLDGLNTLFAFSGIYAAGTFQLSLSQVLLFGIIMNMSAGTGAVILAFVTDKLGAKQTILLCLLALTAFGLGIVLTHNQTLFWYLGGCLSFFVGALQSASRSLLALLVSKEHETMMFGFSALSGKISAFAGPLLLGVTTAFFNSQRAGMASVLVFFAIGGALLFCCNQSRAGKNCS